MDRIIKSVNILLMAAVVILAGYTGWKRFIRPAEDQAVSLKSPVPTDSMNMQVTDLKIMTPETLDPESSESPEIHENSRKTDTSDLEDNRLPHSATPGSVVLREADLGRMLSGNPLYAEAQKVLSGALSENDSISRRRILNYCEHLRMAYITKDLDFLRQVFSDNALIIVGHSVRTGRRAGSAGGSERVRYTLHNKAGYLAKLEKVFAANKRIDIGFSNFSIMRHPTAEGIYGVTLRQKYTSDLYSDDGWLFLLWDFRDPSMPQIHVRTWQPSGSLASPDDRIDISDFDLQ